MGLNEAFRNEKVRFGSHFIDMKLCSRRKGAHHDELIRFKRFVYNDLFMVDDFVAKHSALFFFRCGTMQASRNENGNFGIGVTFSYRSEL